MEKGKKKELLIDEKSLEGEMGPPIVSRKWGKLDSTEGKGEIASHLRAAKRLPLHGSDRRKEKSFTAPFIRNKKEKENVLRQYMEGSSNLPCLLGGKKKSCYTVSRT